MTEPVPPLPNPDDPGWEARARALSAEDRRRLLAEADRFAAGPDADRVAAGRVFRAFEAEIDVTSTAGTARAHCALETLPWLLAEVRPLVERALRTAVDPGLRDRAALVAARFAEAEGDVESAREKVRALLGRVRGRGSRVECFAWFNLAWIAGAHGEHLAALTFSRCALERMPESGDARGTALSHLCRADVFASLLDAERYDEAARAASAAAAALPSVLARPVEFALAQSRARERHRHGDAAASLEALDRAQAIDPSTVADDVRGRRWHSLRAHALLALGRTGEALSTLARARSMGVARDLVDVDLAVTGVRVRAAQGGAIAGWSPAESVLTMLDGTSAVRVGPALRATLAADLARFLDGAHAPPSLVEAAWDIAARAVLAAIRRVSEDLDAHPELGRPDREDLAALRDHARRGAERQWPLGEAAARAWRADHAAGDLVLDEIAGRAGAIHVCAWCLRLRRGDGAWLPLSLGFAPPAGSPRLLHGTCGDCSGGIRGDVERSAARRKSQI